MQAPRTTRNLVLACWFLVAVFSFLFMTTRGLAYRDGKTPTSISHVSELLSSGGNDDFAIAAGAVFAVVALLWGVVRLKSGFSLTGLAVHASLVIMQAVSMKTIEVGSVFDTVVYDRNIVLALWVLSYAGLCIALVIGTAGAIRTRRSVRQQDPAP